MQLTSESFQPYARISANNAFGKADPETGIALAGNRNPHLAWSDAPSGTKSFAILCVDPDAPTDKSVANLKDAPIDVFFPRGNFYHWALANLPASVTQIAEGSHTDGITPGGKPTGPSASGGLQGQNSYTMWFADDDGMRGIYGGYDGPCPPFNDQRVHGYHFTVYALDVAELTLSAEFSADELEEAMAGHILGQATLIGTYSTAE